MTDSKSDNWFSKVFRNIVSQVKHYVECCAPMIYL